MRNNTWRDTIESSIVVASRLIQRAPSPGGAARDTSVDIVSTRAEFFSSKIRVVVEVLVTLVAFEIVCEHPQLSLRAGEEAGLRSSTLTGMS